MEGFTTKVNTYMQLADFFIGKPGPGSVSEALAMQLPVIVECNAWTLPQERYNAVWVVEKEVGIVLHSFREIVGAVEKMIAPGDVAAISRECGGFEESGGIRNSRDARGDSGAIRKRHSGGAERKHGVG